MARFGTAFIDIKPSLDAFGAGLGKKIEAQLAGVTPDLHQKINVDVDRDTLSRAGVALTKQAGDIGSSITSSFADAFRGIATAAGGFLGVGSSFTALGSAAAAAAPLVVGLAVALGVLISSFAAAVAGATALGVALAGALGPVALVAIAAIAKVVSIIKAIHDDGKSAAGSTQALAGAQDQLKSATDGVANAQTNLKTQTAAAYRAWQDSIEAVKDDLLSVQDAQLGIADANLSLREAQLALKEFKKEAPGLQGLFKKFTDVNVDTSGLSKALAEARKASGGKLSQDDSLRLERLILNVRRAKLGEKHATDSLHDANVQLQRDRQTEAGFIKKGIAAYPGYTSAVQGLTTAQRQLASAQRGVAAATEKQAGALAKLSPLEQKLAATFVLISDAVKKAFGPAINAVLGGLNRALRIFVGVLKDPKIVRALKTIGGAIGGVFITLARTFSSKQFRDAFVTLAKGGARLVKILGGKVFKNFALILTDIATAALPALVKLLDGLGDTLDRWATWIKKHPKQFRKDIDGLVGSFLGWLGVIIDVSGFLIDLGGTLKRLGDTAGGIFRGLKDDIASLLGGTDKVSDKVSQLNPKGLPSLSNEPPKPRKGVLGFSPKDVDTINAALGRLRAGLTLIIDTLVPAFEDIFGGAAAIVRGFVVVISGILTGDFAAVWRGIKGIVSGALRAGLGVIELFTAPFRGAAKRLGEVFAKPLHTVLGGLKKAFIAVFRFIVGLINKIHFKVPGIVPVFGGDEVGVHIDDPFANPKPKPKRNLNPKHLPVLTKHPQAKPVKAPTVAPLGGTHTTRSTIVENVNISAPAAAIPDPRFAAVQFSREIAKRA